MKLSIIERVHYVNHYCSNQKVLTENQQMLTKTQQIFLVDEKKVFFSLSDSIRMFSIVNHLLESRKRYLQVFLVKKIHVKMVKKMKNVKT